MQRGRFLGVWLAGLALTALPARAQEVWNTLRGQFAFRTLSGGGLALHAERS